MKHNHNIYGLYNHNIYGLYNHYQKFIYILGLWGAQ